MNADDEDALIAAMVRERRDLRRSIICIKETLRRAHLGFQQAAIAAGSSENPPPDQRIYFPDDATYPDIEQFRDLLKRLQAATARIKEIDQRLDAC